MYFQRSRIKFFLSFELKMQPYRANMLSDQVGAWCGTQSSGNYAGHSIQFAAETDSASALLARVQIVTSVRTAIDTHATFNVSAIILL